MKKLFNYFAAFLPHLNIAFAVTLITCFIIDQLNRMMEFMNNDLTKWLVCIFAALSLIQSVLYIIFRRK